MLKWAINEPRQSYFHNTPEPVRACSLNELNCVTAASLQSTNTPRSLRRQNVENNRLEKNNANQVTSTPLLSTSSTSSPIFRLCEQKSFPRKLDSFRDLSNIFPEYGDNITQQLRKSRSLTKSPLQQIPNCLRVRNRATTSSYASTLPTLDANEYSPTCGLIPGPLLALRGMGIPDAYFEKPRYLMQELDTATVTPASKSQFPTHKATATPYSAKKSTNSPQKSLSSSQMDDTTLERMIDAIIESTQKEHKPSTRSTKHYLTTARPCGMSPTYTPAYDPANDLDEHTWYTDSRYLHVNDLTLQNMRGTSKGYDDDPNERFFCTPKAHKFQSLAATFQRRRQRAVRRKKRLTNLRNTVKKSARKLLRVGSSPTMHVQLPESPTNQLLHCNTRLSPDSGHNSSGGDSSKTDEPEDSCCSNAQSKSNNEFENTKRSLNLPHN